MAFFLFAHNIFDNQNFNLDDQEVVGEWKIKLLQKEEEKCY